MALGLIDAAGLLTFFVAMRTMNVAIAMFLSYLAPIYVAVAAPRVLRQPTERVVYLALVVALGGIALMLVPGLVGHDVKISAVGAACGFSSGLLLGAYFLIVKTLRLHLGGGALMAWDAVIVFLAVLPLGCGRLSRASRLHRRRRGRRARPRRGEYRARRHPFSAWHALHEGAAQLHRGPAGAREGAPLYAFVFLAQRPSVWTLAGGAMILAAGVLVVLFGQAEMEPVSQGVPTLLKGVDMTGKVESAPPLKLTKSMQMFEEAQRLAPGGVMGIRRPYNFVVGEYPIFLDRGYAGHIVDVDGNDYIDMLCAYGPIILGYVEPEINEAAKAQMEKGFCFSLVQPLQNELEQRLIDIMPCGEQAILVKTGSDATTAAIRIGARLHRAATRSPAAATTAGPTGAWRSTAACPRPSPTSRWSSTTATRPSWSCSSPRTRARSPASSSRRSVIRLTRPWWRRRRATWTR